MKLTNVQKEYLKTIYLLEKSEKEVRVTDIANKLNKTKPTVNYAINSLKEEKLINYEVYGPITLTNTGKNAAEKVLEAYDIVCLFFTEILKMEKAEAEHEANKIKATLKDETINKLAKYTNETLGLPSLECGYNINNERCLKCLRRERKNING
ncbi:MAG: metal-dependent transcriptional regulator [Clostridia bacterium]